MSAVLSTPPSSTALAPSEVEAAEGLESAAAARRRRAKLLSMPVVIGMLAALSVGVGLSGFLLSPGRLQLGVAGFSALLMSVVVFAISVRVSKGYLVPPLVVFSCATQVLWIFLFPVFDLETRLVVTEMPFDIIDAPYLMTWSQLIVPLGAILGVLAFRALLERLPVVRAAFPPAPARPPHMGTFLTVTAILLPLTWATGTISGVFGYLFRVAAIATGFAPFLAGRFGDRYLWPRRIWIGAMGVNMLIALVGGGRLVAFFPVLLYVAGVFTRLTPQKRRRLVAYAVLAAVPAMYVSAKIGVLRTRIGRGGLELFTVDRVYTVVTDVLSPSSEGPLDELVATEGLGRMVLWPNLAAVYFTPEFVPYRGFVDLPEEVATYSSVAMLSGETAADQVDKNRFGQMTATHYGFMVDANTGVNFGIIADGWSRGGPLGGVAYGMAVTAFLLLLEELTRWMRGGSYIGYLLLICNVTRATFQVASDPLIYLVRMTVLYISVLVAFIFLAKFVRFMMYGHER